MVDTLHEHQLPVGPLGVGLVLKGPAQLLDGDISLQVVVIRRARRLAFRREVVTCKTNFPIILLSSRLLKYFVPLTQPIQ